MIDTRIGTRIRYLRKFHGLGLRELASKDELHVEASRSHRVLEKLEERKRQRWREEAAREEQRELDELHLLRAARRVRRRGD